MHREPLPAPERLTSRDVLQVILAAMMVPLGVAILVRTLAIAPTVLGVLVGAAFIGFGVYRLWLAGSRYVAYRQNKGGNAK